MKFAGKALTGIFMRCMWDEADVDVIQKQQVVTAKWRMCLPKEMYDLCGNWFMAVQKTMWKRKATVWTVPYYCTSTFQAVTWKNAPIWKTKKTAGCGIDRWSARQRKDQLILHWELLLNLNSTKHCERPPPGIVKLFHYGVQIFVRLLPDDCFLIQFVFRHIKNFVLVMKVHRPFKKCCSAQIRDFKLQELMRRLQRSRKKRKLQTAQAWSYLETSNVL